MLGSCRRCWALRCRCRWACWGRCRRAWAAWAVGRRDGGGGAGGCHAAGPGGLRWAPAVVAAASGPPAAGWCPVASPARSAASPRRLRRSCPVAGAGRPRAGGRGAQPSGRARRPVRRAMASSAGPRRRGRRREDNRPGRCSSPRDGWRQGGQVAKISALRGVCSAHRLDQTITRTRGEILFIAIVGQSQSCRPPTSSTTSRFRRSTC